jgi:hypothetical protein
MMSFLGALGPGGLGPGALGPAWLGLLPKKRSIFVSYHHDSDQFYYDSFSRLFSDTYDIIQDNSVDRIFDSDDPDYVMRRIREGHIKGSSCTIVLCGPETHGRKYVDWEIKATLDKEHGLIGINLPNNPLNMLGQVYVPARLHDNFISNYAIWASWEQLNVNSLKSFIELSIGSPKSSINNERQMLKKNK